MPKKILFVEDDNAFYNVCSISLKLKNYSVLQVADGQLALDRIKEEKPDLVLLDIMLPNKNGLDVLRDLKSDDETKGIRVVMLTNFGSDENVSRALELGAEDYIMKYNIVPSDLADKVAFLLEGTPKSAGPGSEPTS